MPASVRTARSLPRATLALLAGVLLLSGLALLAQYGSLTDRPAGQPFDPASRVAGWEAEAAQGDTEAAFHLAFHAFMEGDREEAVATFRPLAEAGHLGALGMMAGARTHGWGVAVDYDRAAEWKARAAALGDERAARDLAAYYAHTAVGVPE